MTIKKCLMSAGIALTVAACATQVGHHGHRVTAAAKSSADPTPSTAPALPMAVQDFVGAARSQVDVGPSVSDIQLANVGTAVCAMAKAGSSQADLNGVATAQSLHISASDSARIASLAERVICPQSIPKPKWHTLATLTGNGDGDTARFHIGGNGDWELRYTYSCASFGSSGNFAVTEDGGNDMAPSAVAVNELGNGGSGVWHVYSDSGSHWLEILSECDWTLKVREKY